MEPEILNRLKLSIQALGASADSQLLIYPVGACKVDELALDFDHWCDSVLSQHGAELTPLQRSLLEALNARLDRMSGPGNAALWTESALRERQEWEGVRRDSRRILEAFGWPQENPPPTDDFLMNEGGPLNE